MPPTHPLPALASTDLLIAFAGYERAVLCLSEKTVRNHRIYLDAYLDWWHCGHGLTPVATARPGEVAAFLIAEANRGLAPRTRRSELGALRGFYNWLVLTGRALTNPGAAVPSPRISAPPIEIYTPAESIAILDHTASLTDLRGRQRHAIVATLRHTGMRSGELRTLRRADLDLSAGRAMVVGKGSRQRMVLLPPALRPILGQFVAQDRPLLPPSPLLLVNPHPLVTTPLSGFGMDALAREVELAGLGAGLGGRHYPHKWRHTFATEMVRAGVDIHVVQRLLGHAHISSTVGSTPGHRRPARRGHRRLGRGITVPHGPHAERAAHDQMGIGRPSSVANVVAAPDPDLADVAAGGGDRHQRDRAAGASGAGQLRDQLLVTGLSGLGSIMGTVNTSELALPDDYPRLLAELKAQIRSAQWTATRVVNTALIELYWAIGKAILDRQNAAGWGAKVIDQLGVDLSLAFPDSKGFSRRNLHYMRRLAEAWPAPTSVQQPAAQMWAGPELVPQAVAQMPWGHLRVLLDKLDEPAARDWYVRQCIAGGWSRNVLLNQIKGRAHARAGAAPSNFELTLPGEDSELAVQIAKDPYVFDFLGLSGRVAERELEAALVARLRDTLLELGTGFAFVGQQVHLDVGGDDFYIDLLFFNIPQVRYVVVELKIGKFEPESAGKLGFYIAAVDDRLRDPALHAPTVGILMCSDRNDTVVRYALSGAAQPMAVAGYTYDALPPAERAALPSDTRVAAALEAPVDVDGRQMTLAEYLESVGAEPWAGPGHAND